MGDKQQGNWIRLVVLAVALWLGVSAIPAWGMGGLLLAAGAGIWMLRLQLRWRHRLLAMAVAFAMSIFVWKPLGAAATYLAGRPKLIGCYGHQVAPNPDRVTRAEAVSHGLCSRDRLLRSGTWELHNHVIRSLTRMFGVAPGVYDGPYPTEAAATERLDRTEQSLDMAALLEPDTTFQIGGRRVVLPGTLGEDLLHAVHARLPYFDSAWSERPDLRAALVGGRTLVLGFPDPGEPEGYRLIALIDAERGQPFAYYVRGTPVGDLPPQDWLRADFFRGSALPESIP
ncbi:MAG: hypothetical protein AAGF12_18835 [Myxococcota bacterium]